MRQKCHFLHKLAQYLRYAKPFTAVGCVIYFAAQSLKEFSQLLSTMEEERKRLVRKCVIVFECGCIEIQTW